MAVKKLKLYLIPKPIGSSYQVVKKVNEKTCALKATSATITISDVSPETSMESLLKWLKEAPETVNQWTPYRLTVIEEK